MRKTILMAIAIVSIQFVFCQETTPKKSLSAKGNKYWGIGISPIQGDMFYSYLDLNLAGSSNSFGILPAFSYGKFVNDNFMLGGMFFAGFHTNKYSYSYSFPGIGSTSENRRETNYDFGIAPFARYYVPFNQRGSVALYMQAALPFVHSISTNKNNYVTNGVAGTAKNSVSYNTLRGSIGFGVAVKTKFGSVDTHLSNMGWFISFNKLIKKKG